MQYGTCAWTLPKDEIDCFAYAHKKALDGVAIEDGYQHGEQNLRDRTQQEHYLELCDQYGIEIPAIAINSLCTYGMSNEKQFDKVKAILEYSVQVAQAMNVPVLQLPSFGDGAIGSEKDLEQTMRCLEYGISLLQNTEIKLGHENVLSYEDNLKLCKAFQRTSYFVYFDTQNPIRLGGNLFPEKLAVQLYPYIKQIHVKDSFMDNKRPLQLGEGDTKFKDTIKVFVENQYDGWMILESEYKYFAQYDRILEKDIQILKNMFGE